MDEGEINGRVSYYLSSFSLEDKERSLIRELLRGMVQKVAASATLLHELRVLLMDEPMVGMGPEAQRAFKEEARWAQSRERLMAEVNLGELRRRAETGKDMTLEEVFVRLMEGLSNGGR